MGSAPVAVAYLDTSPLTAIIDPPCCLLPISSFLLLLKVEVAGRCRTKAVRRESFLGSNEGLIWVSSNEIKSTSNSDHRHLSFLTLSDLQPVLEVGRPFKF